MHIHLTVLTSCIKGTLDEMFLERCTHAIIVSMELQKTLGQLTIVQSLFVQQTSHNGLVFAISDEVFDSLTFVDHTGIIQCIIECIARNVSEEYLDEIGIGHIGIAIKKLEQILEHS